MYDVSTSRTSNSGISRTRRPCSARRRSASRNRRPQSLHPMRTDTRPWTMYSRRSHHTSLSSHRSVSPLAMPRMTTWLSWRENTKLCGSSPATTNSSSATPGVVLGHPGIGKSTILSHVLSAAVGVHEQFGSRRTFVDCDGLSVVGSGVGERRSPTRSAYWTRCRSSSQTSPWHAGMRVDSRQLRDTFAGWSSRQRPTPR